MMLKFLGKMISNTLYRGNSNLVGKEEKYLILARLCIFIPF